MKVKIKLKEVQGKKKIVNVKTREVREEPETIFIIDIQDIKYNVVRYNPYEHEAIIEISREDYDKIKDKVIEVIEE